MNPDNLKREEEARVANEERAASKAAFKEMAQEVLQEENYCGELLAMDYESAVILVQDKYRRECGGIPYGCFLIATRTEMLAGDADDEDAAFILLRVQESAPLHNQNDADRIRTESAQGVVGDTKENWDASHKGMDAYSKYAFSCGALRCKILGTFYFENRSGEMELCFGSDISNFYSNYGLKIFKPTGTSLEKIVNYTDPGIVTDPELRALHAVKEEIGSVRYTSTNRTKREKPENARFEIRPSDMLAQRTMVFGISRSGKSNTVKIIIKAIHDLCQKEKELNVGQVVFDYNGEYANDNVQDKGALASLRDKSGQPASIYALTNPKKSPRVKTLRFDFSKTEFLQQGKEIIDAALEGNESTLYVSAFRSVRLHPELTVAPMADQELMGEAKRESRRQLVYRCILNDGGLLPSVGPDSGKNLFNKLLLGAMEEIAEALDADRVGGPRTGDRAKIKELAKKIKPGIPELRKPTTWGGLRIGLIALQCALEHGDLISIVDEKGQTKKPMADFMEDYRQKNKKDWADKDLMGLLGFLSHPGGWRRLAPCKDQHDPLAKTEFSDQIYTELSEGRLVIVDFSAGSDATKAALSERIAQKVFEGNFTKFKNAESPTKIQVYIEEAHNLLAGIDKKDGLKNIWIRMAKEGSKCGIGMVAITQEPSSLPPNILKNAGNWFVGHLNNEEEVKTVSGYYDFEDFGASIRRCADRGFVRVKTLSSAYTCPVMVRLFEL